MNTNTKRHISRQELLEIMALYDNKTPAETANTYNTMEDSSLIRLVGYNRKKYINYILESIERNSILKDELDKKYSLSKQYNVSINSNYLKMLEIILKKLTHEELVGWAKTVNKFTRHSAKPNANEEHTDKNQSSPQNATATTEPKEIGTHKFVMSDEYFAQSDAWFNAANLDDQNNFVFTNDNPPPETKFEDFRKKLENNEVVQALGRQWEKAKNHKVLGKVISFFQGNTARQQAIKKRFVGRTIYNAAKYGLLFACGLMPAYIGINLAKTGFNIAKGLSSRRDFERRFGFKAGDKNFISALESNIVAWQNIAKNKTGEEQLALQAEIERRTALLERAKKESAIGRSRMYTDIVAPCVAFGLTSLGAATGLGSFANFSDWNASIPRVMANIFITPFANPTALGLGIGGMINAIKTDRALNGKNAKPLDTALNYTGHLVSHLLGYNLGMMASPALNSAINFAIDSQGKYSPNMHVNATSTSQTTQDNARHLADLPKDIATGTVDLASKVGAKGAQIVGNAATSVVENISNFIKNNKII
jgi:hypothetical protein